MDRRAFLSVGLCLAGGCLGFSSPGGFKSATETATRSATSADSDVPEGVPIPSDDCTAASHPGDGYPTLPESLTASRAMSFALAYETALARSDVETDMDGTVSGIDSSGTLGHRRTDAGHVVGAYVSLDYAGDRSQTPTVVGSYRSEGWYYVSDSFAARTRSGDDANPPPTDGWEIVACE